MPVASEGAAIEHDIVSCHELFDVQPGQSEDGGRLTTFVACFQLYHAALLFLAGFFAALFFFAAGRLLSFAGLAALVAAPFAARCVARASLTSCPKAMRRRTRAISRSSASSSGRYLLILWATPTPTREPSARMRPLRSIMRGSSGPAAP